MRFKRSKMINKEEVKRVNSNRSASREIITKTTTQTAMRTTTLWKLQMKKKKIYNKCKINEHKPH